MSRPDLTVELLCEEARRFAEVESEYSEPSIYGVTDGKAIGTYLEHKFRNYLGLKYSFVWSSSAPGIDFPVLAVDIKVTSVRQPQSSSPFRSARQKIYGLGYSLILFVYEKTDDPLSNSAKLDVLHTIFVHQTRTADFQTTSGILRILENQGNEDDLVAFLEERRLPADDIEARELAEEMLMRPPELVYLTISNALQWRLQYKRVIDAASKISGITRIR